MTKTRSLFITGILVAIMPYLGFPYFWKNVLLAILGLGIALFAYAIRRESRKVNSAREEAFDNFSENSFREDEPVETREKIRIEEIKLS